MNELFKDSKMENPHWRNNKGFKIFEINADCSFYIDSIETQKRFEDDNCPF